MADLHSQDASAAQKDPVASLAGQIRHASTGTLARLRRSDPVTHPRAALFERERMLQAAGITAHGAERERWAQVLHCLALVQGRHDSRADAEPGKVLHGLHFSEARLEQLIEADEPLLFTLMPRVARRLAAAGATVNWKPLAALLLGTGSDDPQREVWADEARQRLVRHFIGAQGVAEAGALRAAEQDS
jgi:CRISPR type I-E-associated protein CasB/Cse2